jgi:hypothetical protein
MVRYGLMSRPAISEPLKPKIIPGTKAWHDDQNARALELDRARIEEEYHSDVFMPEASDFSGFPKF